MNAVAALIRKDLRMELRTRESVPSMFLFSLSTFVLFRFGLDRETLCRRPRQRRAVGDAPVRRRAGDEPAVRGRAGGRGFDAFLLAPVDRTSLFVAKAAVLFGFLVAVEFAAIPAFAVLLLGPSPFQALPGLLAILALADAGIAIIGTLVGALAIQTRARDLIVPLIALPLVLPVVIAAGHATVAAVRRSGRRGTSGPLAGGARPL